MWTLLPNKSHVSPALPQHFDTADGHFRNRKQLRRDHTCTALDNKKAPKQQKYNAVYDDVFAKLCQPEEQSGKECRHLRRVCTVNPLKEDVSFQSVFKFWTANNCTEQIEREQRRLSGPLNGSVTATIYSWNVFDVFDVPAWNNKDGDCSHLCYVPALFEASFNRLELLLSPLLAAFWYFGGDLLLASDLSEMARKDYISWNKYFMKVM